MSLFDSPEKHAANPPSTWRVVRAGTRQWTHVTSDGAVIGGPYDRKRDAEDDLATSFYATLWDKERRWYAGEPVSGWRPYVDCLADQIRTLLARHPDRSWTPSLVARHLKVDTTAAGNALRQLAAADRVAADGNGAWTRYSYRAPQEA